MFVLHKYLEPLRVLGFLGSKLHDSKNRASGTRCWARTCAAAMAQGTRSPWRKGAVVDLGMVEILHNPISTTIDYQSHEFCRFFLCSLYIESIGNLPKNVVRVVEGIVYHQYDQYSLGFVM